MNDIRTLLEHGKITSLQVTVFLVCIVMNMLDGMDVLVIAYAAPALAAERELVVLQTGLSAKAEILETTPEWIRVRVRKEEQVGEAKLYAKRLDPHSFYDIRSKHMEDTAENHVRLELAGLYWHFVDLVWVLLFTIIYLF